jgi:hypothetical protein
MEVELGKFVSIALHNLSLPGPVGESGGGGVRFVPMAVIHDLSSPLR